MGFLNILAYIGVGLLATGIFIGLSFAISRPKEIYLYEDGSTEKGHGEGDWGVASILSTLGFWLFATLLLINLAHFSIFKSIGLGLVASIAMFFLSGVVSNLFKGNSWKFLTITLCTLNGVSFAILAYNWGWF